MHPQNDLPTSIGPYRVVRRLGTGGMGQVFLGIHRNGQAAAVKLVLPELALRPDLLRRFRREVDLLGKITNEFVARIVDSNVAVRPYWLATEYVQGMTVEEAVKQHGKLDHAVVRSLAVSCCRALEAIHALGIIHRDFHPGNLIMCADGLRVVDFGIAYELGATNLTGTFERIGRPGYMAPEYLGDGSYNEAVDIFALGAMLAYASQGRHPFLANGANRRAVLEAVLNAQPVLDDVPTSLQELIRSCLSKDPRHRPTASAMLGMLAADQNTAPARGVGWLPPTLAMTVLTQTARSAPMSPQAPISVPFANGVGAPLTVSRVPEPVQQTLRRRKIIAAEENPGLWGYLGSCFCGPVAISPDGRYIAGGGETQRGPAIYDLITEERFIYPPRPGCAGSFDNVTALAFSPDGQLLATGNNDGSVRLRQMPGRESFGRPFTVGCPILQVAFSADSSFVASISTRQMVTIHELYTEKSTTLSLKATCIAFSADGQFVAYGRADGAILVHHMASGESLYDTPFGHSRYVTALAFSTDGQHVGSGSADCRVGIWHLQDSVPAGDTFVGHSATVNAVAFSPSGGVLASASTDGTVRFWSPAGRPQSGRSVANVGHDIRSMAYSPDDGFIAVSTASRIELWS